MIYADDSESKMLDGVSKIYLYETSSVMGYTQDHLEKLLQVYGKDGYRLVAIHEDYIIMEKEEKSRD